MCLNNTSRTHCCATTATMAMPARHSVMLYVNSLSCYCFIQRRCHLLLFHGSVVEKRNVIMENWWNTDGKKKQKMSVKQPHCPPKTAYARSYDRTKFFAMRSAAYMEPKCSVPCSQEPNKAPYPATNCFASGFRIKPL